MYRSLVILHYQQLWIRKMRSILNKHKVIRMEITKRPNKEGIAFLGDSLAKWIFKELKNWFKNFQSFNKHFRALYKVNNGPIFGS